MTRIAIASDHAALAMKADLVAWLVSEGHDVSDLGPHDGASVDYPDYGMRCLVRLPLALLIRALHFADRGLAFQSL